MWKIRDKPLANEFSHINRDNLNFAANLRKDSHIRLEKEEKPIVVTSRKQEQTTISQTDAAHRILIRVLCNRSDCIKMSGSIEAALDEVSLFEFFKNCVLLISLTYMYIEGDAYKINNGNSFESCQSRERIRSCK